MTTESKLSNQISLRHFCWTSLKKNRQSSLYLFPGVLNWNWESYLLPFEVSPYLARGRQWLQQCSAWLVTSPARGPSVGLTGPNRFLDQFITVKFSFAVTLECGNLEFYQDVVFADNFVHIGSQFSESFYIWPKLTENITFCWNFSFQHFGVSACLLNQWVFQKKQFMHILACKKIYIYLRYWLENVRICRSYIY